MCAKTTVVSEEPCACSNMLQFALTLLQLKQQLPTSEAHSVEGLSDSAPMAEQGFSLLCAAQGSSSLHMWGK
ncbi:hypothetical protein FQA47_025700 [Oryzias melastigma]|uniref:Uncharacterized protein n=1 Tax=Oryzias melastigma TaxID=30732 RepID=A0A834CLG1_ORYME|nr:hypothetical protein FQA47_025700 [Oryzias melastigma]